MGPGDPVPGMVSSRSVWRPADFADASEWMVALSAAERGEIVAAARASAGSGLSAATVRREAFPLPGLAAKLVGWVRELSAGRAFVLMRGFPVYVLSEPETALAYVGLGLQLGTPVSQNAAGDLLGHVRDTGVVRDSPAVRLYATNQRQDFHCDGSDLVGLLCLKPAKTGGESKIVSSMAVYNQMLASRHGGLALDAAAPPAWVQPMAPARRGVRIRPDRRFWPGGGPSNDRRALRGIAVPGFRRHQATEIAVSAGW